MCDGFWITHVCDAGSHMCDACVMHHTSYRCVTQCVTHVCGVVERGVSIVGTSTDECTIKVPYLMFQGSMSAPSTVIGSYM